MRNTGRKVMTWLAIAGIAYYLVTQPQGAAGVVRGIGAFLQQGFQALIQFLSGVFA
jgi:hypothetical protein